MSDACTIHGIARERPRHPERGIFDEYDGEDLYHPNQPTTGQINEMLLQFSGKYVIVCAVHPGKDDTDDEIAEEFMHAVQHALQHFKPLTEYR